MRPDYSPSIKTSGSLSIDDQSSRQLAFTAAEAAEDRKGGEIVLLHIAEVSYLADYFVIVTGFSKAQVRAISQAVGDKVEELWHRQPLRREGQAEGSWVLLDYGEVIVHILMPQEREYYDLESFWAHAEKVNFPSDELGNQSHHG